MVATFFTSFMPAMIEAPVRPSMSVLEARRKM
jgi:hypothetical protein